MKKELLDLHEVDEKINNKLKKIKENSNNNIDDMNLVKAVKNDIYERTSKVVVNNLKKLIQLELTQKNFAKKVGVAEDLLSKYKSGDTFPSFDTLIYICNVYNISIDKFINTPLTYLEIEKIESNQKVNYSIFKENYYVYFLVTNTSKEGALHEGIIEIYDNYVTFKILSNEIAVKIFTGDYSLSDKLVYFNLNSVNDGNVNITMIKPNINKSKYVGGLALLSLSSDANSKPCSQKILFSKTRINRTTYCENLKELLSFYIGDKYFGNVKISQVEDELAYTFIEKLPT